MSELKRTYYIVEHKGNIDTYKIEASTFKRALVLFKVLVKEFPEDIVVISKNNSKTNQIVMLADNSKINVHKSKHGLTKTQIKNTKYLTNASLVDLTKFDISKYQVKLARFKYIKFNRFLHHSAKLHYLDRLHYQNSGVKFL